VNVNEQKPVANLVTQIQNAKRDNPAADTSKLESEIDLLVYRLYGLNDEEKGIVENNGII